MIDAPTILSLFAFYFSVVFFLVIRHKTLLTYFQQEEYDYLRFFKSCLKVRLFDVKVTSLLIISLIFFNFYQQPNFLFYLISTVIFWGVAFLEKKFEYKKALVMTDRARRILWVSLVISITLFILLSAISNYLIILSVQLLPLSLICANGILNPFQTKINKHFIDLGKSKLTRINPVRIGITGSFGKTTVKHILADMLLASGPVSYSKGSINTILGLTRHLRKRLQWSHKYFVAEMGAYGIGSIDRLCDFVEPQYGIVTSVGAAHIERFGSKEIVAQAKSELVKCVCEKGGVSVVDAAVLDFSPFKTLKRNFPQNVLTVGRDDKCDIQVVSSDLIKGFWKIVLAFNYQSGKQIEYTLPLLGEHNIVNSALAAALVNAIDSSSIDELSYYSRSVAQVPHRLQKVEISGQPLILDDAFNSNETGFRNAIQVLKTLSCERRGKSILITPGLAELGIEHDDTHFRLGQHAAQNCDEIIIVNSDRIPTFLAGCKQNRTNLHLVSTLAEARQKLSKIAAVDDVILYENDLPDVLEEKRTL